MELTGRPILGNKILESDIDGLKIFKFYTDWGDKIRIHVVPGSDWLIKSFEEKKDRKDKDTFDLSDWWKSNRETLPGFTYVWRTVLTNSPNSFECLFIIFNMTYNDDQKSSYTDYIELSIQSQFNKRDL